MLRFLGFLACAFSLLVPQGSDAAEVEVLKGHPYCHLKLSGDITSGDAKRLKAAIDTLENGRSQSKLSGTFEQFTALCLNSPGGAYVEGLQIMDVIKDNDVGTVVDNRDICFSSCALIFMTGRIALEEGLSDSWRYLHVGGTLGFHAPYHKLTAETFSRDEVKNLLEGVTLTTSWLLRNSERGAIPTSLISEMLQYGPNEVLKVDTILDITRWKIAMFGASVPLAASKEAAVRLCQNEYLLERYDVHDAVDSRDMLKPENLPDLYKLTDNVTMQKAKNGFRISVPGYPPEGTRICVVDFVIEKGKVVSAHQEWDFDYEEKRPPFAKGKSLSGWQFLPIYTPLRSLLKS